MTRQSLESSPSISVSTGNEPANCTAREIDEFLCNLAEGYLPCASSEPCTSSPDLEAGFLPTYYSDTNLSARSRSMSIASRSCQRGKKTVVFPGFPSLQMSRDSTDALGEELLTWFLGASRARTSAPQERGPGSMANEAGCGEKWRELSVRYDPDSSSWRTHRCLWDEGLRESSVTLPKWGSMRDGVLWERTTLALPTSGSGAGLWRTPTVGMLNADRAKDPEYTARKEAKGQTITLADQVKNPRMFPTPTASLGTKGGRVTPRKSREGGTLIEAVSARAMWPTPKANDVEKRGDFDVTNPRNGLPAAVKRFATPQARDHRTGQLERYENPDRTKNLNDQIGGQLNPTWVEWLMGWPLGWTDLKPSATDKCRNAQRRHGGF